MDSVKVLKIDRSRKKKAAQRLIRQMLYFCFIRVTNRNICEDYLNISQNSKRRMRRRGSVVAGAGIEDLYIGSDCILEVTVDNSLCWKILCAEETLILRYCQDSG